MLYFFSPCSKEHGCCIVRHSNGAKQRKCPIMDWKASKERVGGSGHEVHLYRDSAVCWAAVFWYLSKPEQKSWFPQCRTTRATATNTDTPKGVNRQKTQRSAFLTGSGGPPTTLPTTTYGEGKQLDEKRSRSCTQVNWKGPKLWDKIYFPGEMTKIWTVIHFAMLFCPQKFV